MHRQAGHRLLYPVHKFDALSYRMAQFVEVVSFEHDDDIERTDDEFG